MTDWNKKEKFSFVNNITYMFVLTIAFSEGFSKHRSRYKYLVKCIIHIFKMQFCERYKTIFAISFFKAFS